MKSSNVVAGPSAKGAQAAPKGRSAEAIDRREDAATKARAETRKQETKGSLAAGLYGFWW